MAESNNLQSSLLQAIDYLVNNRIDKISRDTTITATIKKVSNSLTGEYQVNYNGGFLMAYAQEGASYSENESVYVLVPEGDFSKRKLIVGKASKVTSDNNITAVSSLMNDYNMIGRNVIVDGRNVLPVGLHSYLSSDYILLYQHGDEENSRLSFNESEFSNYVKDSEALLIEASFMTRLPKAHRLAKNGKYGIQYVLAFKDSSSGEVNMYDEYLPKTDSMEDNDSSVLDSCKKKMDEIWGSAELTSDQKTQKTNELISELQEAVKNDDDAINAATKKQTAQKFADSLAGAKTKEQVDEAFAKMENETVPRVKYVSYTLDSNNMTGNPFLYNSYTDQYAIFPIDAKNYLYVDSIMIWSEGFVDKDDSVQSDFWGADILVKEPEIYGLRKISATNGDYVLRLSTPKGALFTSFEKTDVLRAVGTVTYQINTNVTDSTSYYWFVKDDRVDASSETYNVYGGSGWRYLKDKGNNREMQTTGYENRAYENVYQLVAVYKEQVVLKQEFTLYNEAASRNITISSDLGTVFSFDRGKPTLTCLIDGHDGVNESFDPRYPDSYFTFSWSKIDDLAGSIPFVSTYDELKKQYDDAIASGKFDYSTLASIRNNMIAMNGVEFNRNILKYPVNQIATTAKFSCSVFLRETADGEDFFVGSANITLQNEGVASPNDYYILIKNGDQVFQYSESGVAPTSERYQDPQEVLPLECKFYDPAGLEVDKNTYSVKWKVPLESTMIKKPSKGMILNPASNLEEWYGQEVYPLAIDDDYDYQATINQVTCIVSYHGTEYQKESDLFFTKVGENGTNGTDVVCKISPLVPPRVGLLAIKTVDGQNPEWNNGQPMGTAPLKFSAYNRNELLSVSNVSWVVSGGTASQSRFLSIDRNLGTILWGDKNSGHRNQIIRGSATFEGQTYYAFYPIPHIDYHDSTQYEVVIDKNYTLKSILYNADGRNPLYNKNQGVFFSLSDGSRDKHVTFDVMGGHDDNSSTADFTISTSKNGKPTFKTVSVTEANEDGLYGVYITPNDVYDGAWCNNLVRARIYGSKDEVGQNPEAEVYVPIYMSLNTFGLSSLNAWDGNHVEINEDENYILAPQIGAGVKDDNNRFTGVVMGKAQTYDEADPTVGLLGFSKGKQSIFLDAETGNATFGLPEDNASAGNKFMEGRIELVPGGESKIGAWSIGSRAMYNMTKPPEPKLDASGTPITDEKGNIIFEDGYVGVKPDGPYTDYPVPDAQISIPHNAQGLILNADPAYISVKGMPLNDKNSKIQFDDANTTIKRGDSIEVELDPRKGSVFSIYRHTTYDSDVDTGKWRRYPLVGINANGQFYTNAVEDGESSMGIGKIGAFGSTAADNKWVGAQFAYLGTNIFKFFVPSKDFGGTTEKTRPMYITAGTDTTTEYPRDFNLYGKTFNVFTNQVNSTDVDSPHWLKISNDVTSIGHTNNYIQIPSASGSYDKNFEIKTQADADISFMGKNTSITNSQNMNFSTKTFVGRIDCGSSNNQAATLNIVGNATISGFRDMTLQNNLDNDADKSFVFSIRASATSNASGTEVSTAQMKLGNKKTFLELNNDTTSKLFGANGMNLESDTGAIKIRSNRASGGIQIDAIPVDGNSAQGYPLLHLTPQTGGTGDFRLSSGHGTVQSLGNLGNNRMGVQITPGFSSGWGIFTGTPDQNSTVSVKADRDIWAVNGWMYGGNFCFNTSKSWSAHGGTYNSTSIEQHLAWLYSLVSNAYYRADSAYTRAETAERNATAAANRAYDLANSKASSGSLDDLRGMFLRHTHHVTAGSGFSLLTGWDTFTLNGANVSHITGTRMANGVSTSVPQY